MPKKAEPIMADKINLGCGDRTRKGWTNVDKLPGAGDVTHDLRITPWPFGDECASEIEALDVLEHLPDTVAFMDECWRILRRDGVLTIRVPTWNTENAWRDPTHVRAFHMDTFQYFTDDNPWGGCYGHAYTSRRWRILERTGGDAINVRMQPIKG